MLIRFICAMKVADMGKSCIFQSSPVKMETDDLVVDRCEKIAEKKVYKF